MSGFSDSFNPQIDRYDPESAGRLFRRLWPHEATLKTCASFLADSIRVAHGAGEGCWSITMFPRKIRLNVGQVETLILTADTCRVLFRAPLECPADGRFAVYQTESPVFKAVPVPSGVCELAPENAANLPDAMRAAHNAYIEAAASYKRTSPFKSAFSPAILRWLEMTTGEPLPRPSYHTPGHRSLVEPLPDELRDSTALVEGARYQITVNAYERDPEARNQCIARQGDQCVICGFSFGACYGEVAEGFIHVHHVRPLADIGQEYRVDPDADLRPVCPNCHAVLHRRTPPYSIEEVRTFLQNRRAERQVAPPS